MEKDKHKREYCQCTHSSTVTTVEDEWGVLGCVLRLWQTARGWVSLL